MNDAAWAFPIITMFASAIAFLYKKQSDLETGRADRAEKRAEDLQKIINDRAVESEQIAQQTIRENVGLRAELDVLRDRVDRGQKS